MRTAWLRNFLVLVHALFALNGFAFSSHAGMPDGVIVKFKSEIRPAGMAHFSSSNSNDFQVIRFIDSLVRTPDNRLARLKEKIEDLEKDKNVMYAEPNYVGHFDTGQIASSTHSSSVDQWWLAAVSDTQIKALGRGTGITVAVIDTGVDLTHPDLRDKILPNGTNIGDNTAFVQDLLGHGTMMAGIIAASSETSHSGIRSLAPEAKILPIKINKGNENAFTSAHLAEAINYAVNNHAKVINLSLGLSNPTQTVRDAIQNALNQGVIIVASAGNQSSAVDFPANIPGVIAVASSNQSNQLAFFSNTGPEISIAAPGVDIFTTTLGGGYGSGNGTSYSAPIVVAAVADLLSINMTLPPGAFIDYLLQESNTMVDSSHTFGSLNAGAASDRLLPHISASIDAANLPAPVIANYQLPRTGAPVDIYVAVKTPMGEFSLLQDGSWAKVEGANYQPVALNYQNANDAAGVLFGGTGRFPPISKMGLPSGDYVWRSALVFSGNRQMIGGISESMIRLN